MNTPHQNQNPMVIQVLGTGCANCRNTIALIQQVAQARGTAIMLSKVAQWFRA